MNKKILAAALILGGLWVLAIFLAFVFSFSGSAYSGYGGNIAVIPVNGLIMIDDSPQLFGGEAVASSEKIIKYIDDADKDPNVRAILFDINSGGGSPVATDEIAQKIKSVNKTKIAVIREVGASGAYWVASSTDYIFANRMSITGSIGVIGSYLDYAGIMRRYNISYERYVSGQYKDIGTPFREPTEEERKMYQQMLDRMHEFFMQEVSRNRNLPMEKVRNISTGMVYLGVEAKDLGLVDELGTKADAIAYLERKLNITASLVEYQEKPSLLSLLGGVSAFSDLKIAKYLNPSAQISLIRA